MHHFCTGIRISIYKIELKNMKQITEITFCFIVLLGIQLLLNNGVSNSHKDNQVFAEIGYSGIILEDFWNNEFADDNDVEFESPSGLKVNGRNLISSFVADIFSRPKQPSLLSPLFVDRPPPDLCL